MSEHTSSENGRFHVLIAGAGVAGLEAAFALQGISADTFDVTILAPESDFVYRPLSVREPFSYAAAKRLPLDRIVSDAGANLVTDSFSWVERDERVAHTASATTIAYDALVLAVGAKRYDVFPKAITLDDRTMESLYHGIVQDVEMGYVTKLAFVMPATTCWPLPLYELALMTGQSAFGMGIDVEITIITPESAPLDVFGAEGSTAVSELLQERGISIRTHAKAHVPSSRTVVIEGSDGHIEADRIIALPHLMGPSIRGIRAADEGFIPVDQHCQVIGAERIFAAGDAVNSLVKHGGLSSQQADKVAEQIGYIAGVSPAVGPLWPHIEGILLTGKDPLYISAKLVSRAGYGSQVSTEPLWSPPTKTSTKYLGPYLEKIDPVVR